MTDHAREAVTLRRFAEEAVAELSSFPRDHDSQVLIVLRWIDAANAVLDMQLTEAVDTVERLRAEKR